MASKWELTEEEKALLAPKPAAPRAELPPQEQPSFGQEIMATAQSLPPAIGTAALNAAQAPTFGYFDELTSQLPYGPELEQFRQQRNREYPAAGMLAEGGAGLMTGAMAGPRVAAQMARLPAPWMTAVGDTAAAGAAAALYGSGSAEPGGRGAAATEQGLIGAALSPVANVATRVGGAIISPIADAVGNLFRSTDSQAARTVGRNMAEQGVPVDIPAQEARQAQVNVPPGAVPPYVNADTDPAAAQQLKELYDRVPGARGEIQDQLEARQRQTPVRVVEDIAAVTGLPRDTRQGIDTLLADTKRRMAREGYGELADQTIPISNNMIDMFTGPEAPFMRRAYQQAEAIAAREGNPIPRYNDVFGENGTLEELPIHAMDYMQRAFRNAGKPNITNPTYDHLSWRSLRDRFLGEVDNASPEFRNVRRIYATQSSLQDAARQGQDLYRLGDARDVQDLFNNLSQPEQVAFRRGALDAIEGQVRNMGAKSGNVDTRLAGTQNKDELLDVVFGEQANAVRQILGREDSFNRTYSQVLGGSATSKNLRGGGTIVDMVQGGGLFDFLQNQGRRVANEALGPSPQTMNRTIQMLMQQGFTPQQAARIAAQGNETELLRTAGQAAAGGSTMVLPGLISGWLSDEERSAR